MIYVSCQDELQPWKEATLNVKALSLNPNSKETMIDIVTICNRKMTLPLSNLSADNGAKEIFSKIEN